MLARRGDGEASRIGQSSTVDGVYALMFNLYTFT